jgi:F0F1-type ATP synthase delta subunit
MVQGVSEMKMLINSIYQYYSAQEDINDLLSNQNPFYECFLDQIISSNSESEKTKFLQFLQENRFMQAYEKLTKACFNLKYEEHKPSNGD